jgi:SHS2 domain-containing protein
MKDFELIDHTADLQIRVYGATIEELFRNALCGMFQAIKPDIAGCAMKDDRIICKDLPRHHEIKIESPDQDALLIDFLSRALYLSDVHNEAYLAVTIHTLSDTKIEATIHGAPITGFANVEIKAVTYHDVHIQKKDGLWQTDIVFDI